MMEGKDFCDIFHSENNIFITSTSKINGTDLKQFFLEKLSKENVIFPKGTTFYIIAGFHHTSKDSVMGRTDLNLSQDFYYDLIPDLEQFCGNLNCEFCNCKENKFGECGNPSIWEKMEYENKLVILKTDKKPNKTFEINPVALKDLTKLATNLKKKDGLSTFVFASCFSKNSMVNQLLRSKGIISIAQLVKDMYDVTDGKMCQLDEQQLKVLNDINMVRLWLDCNDDSGFHSFLMISELKQSQFKTWTCVSLGFFRNGKNPTFS